ncbi:MAG: hypothetical protein EWV76_17265 [Microcystis novacekii Mn_MB_F_20050700_S1]|nr:MAG: hypothetical protein EWV76_17265 [Microcystis novacekii Mn_MB_F_20050700_S1]
MCDLSRRRWQIESAFLLTKRLLGLAYLWVGHRKGVQIQILATLIHFLYGFKSFGLRGGDCS